LPTFLHVGEYVPADPEHPSQGAPPYLKLVTQPPTQLPVVFSSLASFADTDPGADGDWVGCDVRRDTVLLATALCFGLVTCFGASTRTPGSEVAELVAVCDIAVPLRPYSSSIDKITTAGLATKSEENLMAMSSQNRDGNAIPMRTIAHIQLA
jgi:hypothetical protein